MALGKVIFIGNQENEGTISYLYDLIREDKRLLDYESHDLDIFGFDLLTYIDPGDNIIIISSACSKTPHPEAKVLEEEDLSADLSIVSDHDLCITQAATILQAYKPDIERVRVIMVELPEHIIRASDIHAKELEELKESIIAKITGGS